MKESHNHSDEFLRDRLINYNFPKQPGSWEKMEKMLPRKSRWSFFPIAGVTLFVISSITIGSQYLTEPSDSDTLADNSSIQIKESGQTNDSNTVNIEQSNTVLNSDRTSIQFTEDVSIDDNGTILANATVSTESNKRLEQTSETSIKSVNLLNQNKTTTTHLSSAGSDITKGTNHNVKGTNIAQATINNENDGIQSNATTLTSEDNLNTVSNVSVPMSDNNKIDSKTVVLSSNVKLATSELDVVAYEQPPIDIELVNSKKITKSKISLSSEILTGIQLGAIDKTQIFNVAAGLHAAYAFNAKFSLSLGLQYRMQWFGTSNTFALTDQNLRMYNDGLVIHHAIAIERMGNIDLPIQFHIRLCNPISLTLGARMSMLTELVTESVVYEPSISDAGIQPFDVVAQLGVGWHIQPNLSLHLMYGQSFMDITKTARSRYENHQNEIADFQTVDANLTLPNHFISRVSYEKLAMYYLEIPDLLSNSFLSLSLRYKF